MKPAEAQPRIAELRAQVAHPIAKSGGGVPTEGDSLAEDTRSLPCLAASSSGRKRHRVLFQKHTLVGIALVAACLIRFVPSVAAQVAAVPPPARPRPPTRLPTAPGTPA